MTLYEKNAKQWLDGIGKKPGNMQDIVLQLNLIMEEFDEFVEAVNNWREVDISDVEACDKAVKDFFKEIGDLQYVMSGFYVLMGIPIESIYMKVHESNLSKLTGGKLLTREDGKVLKGKSYKAPNLSKEVEEWSVWFSSSQ